MRSGTKAALVRQLREVSTQLAQAIDQIAMADDEHASFTVSWPGDGERKIQFQEKWIHEEKVESLAAGAIWALFESQRPGDDPSDRRTFERVMARVTSIAASRCHQERDR